MRLLARSLWMVGLPVLVFGACSEVTTPANTAPVAIAVSTWPGYAQRLEDVELCETGTSRCVRTNANGEATLYLPFEVETSFTRAKSGYASYLLPLEVPPSGASFGLSMATNDRLAEQHENMMSPYPMQNTGTIVFDASPNVEGATLDLVGATGKPFYMDQDLDWRPDLTATTSRGTAGFTEVGPGEDYRIELGGNGEGCVIEKGWPGRFEDSVRFPVRAGFLIDIRVVCP